MEKAYSAVKVAKEGYKIYGPNEKPVQNHRKKELPIIPEGVAKYFCEDLNEIYRKNRAAASLETAKRNPSYALLKTEVPEKELAESFSYCFLSTMMEAEEKNFTFEVEAAIKEGFLCRYFITSPGMNDLEMAKPLSLYFDQVGIHFTENFSSEKGRSNTTFQIIRHFEDLLKEMEPYQRLMVQLLYQFFDNFSIALPILWVMGRLNESEVVKAYWMFQWGQNQVGKELAGKSPSELPNFLQRRLHYLKITSRTFVTKKRFTAI